MIVVNWHHSIAAAAAAAGPALALARHDRDRNFSADSVRLDFS